MFNLWHILIFLLREAKVNAFCSLRLLYTHVERVWKLLYKVIFGIYCTYVII